MVTREPGGTGGSTDPDRGDADGRTYGPSSLGRDPNVLAATGYQFPFLGYVFYRREETSDFVRFHGLQSVAVSVVVLGGGLVLSTVVSGILWVLLSVLPAGFLTDFLLPLGIVVVSVSVLPFLVLLVALALLTYKSYRGEWYELPVLGHRVRDRL